MNKGCFKKGTKEAAHRQFADLLHQTIDHVFFAHLFEIVESHDRTKLVNFLLDLVRSNFDRISLSTGRVDRYQLWAEGSNDLDRLLAKLIESIKPTNTSEDEGDKAAE